ncbi:MAG: sigma 54-interacting transcriptional regulator [Blastocatellia bacterium]|nr:sigma 54-interacting transcriptional regulator [Blastocatellia bacterium]
MQPVKDVNLERRQTLVLRAWEAVSTERELQGVLEAITQVLVPVVPYNGVAIIHFDGANHDCYAAHVVGFPRREGETLKEYFDRPEFIRPVETPTRPLAPYSTMGMELKMSGAPYVCNDLLAKESWYEHEFNLAASGIRAYTSVPMIVREKLIGIAVFTRIEPMAFTEGDLAILGDISRALAVAVANALANEEIHKLRDQLEQENFILREQLCRVQKFDEIVGDGPAIRRALDAVEQVAATDATVLITGETGTGKELIARAIHRLSPRAHGPLVKFNCAAIPHTLLASELFGHERGAFTGAVARRKGRFEQANSGTLFLDEIGELPSEMQVMLLRVLQEREFERLGGAETVRVDVRIVAATNRDLAEDARAGRFRSDLYYRLNVFPVHLPPLRERAEDIPLLTSHFVAKHGARFGRAISRIDRRTMSLLASYHWPGNVRELENVIERAVILSRNGALRVERDTLPSAVAAGNVDERLQSHEREALESALRASRGRVSGPNGAAKALGLAPSTLEFRIKRLGIDKFRFR